MNEFSVVRILSMALDDRISHQGHEDSPVVRTQLLPLDSASLKPKRDGHNGNNGKRNTYAPYRRLLTFSHVDGNTRGRTIALRDYVRAWEANRRKIWDGPTT